MYAHAVLTSGALSLPFVERTIPLHTPITVLRANSKNVAQNNNATFDCKSMTRRHARLWYDKDSFYLEDLNSSNGTFVNGKRLTGKSHIMKISTGDNVQFGATVTLPSSGKQSTVTHFCVIASVKLYKPGEWHSIARPRKSSVTRRIKDIIPQTPTLTIEHDDELNLHSEGVHRNLVETKKAVVLNEVLHSMAQVCQMGTKVLPYQTHQMLLSGLVQLQKDLETYAVESYIYFSKTIPDEQAETSEMDTSLNTVGQQVADNSDSDGILVTKLAKEENGCQNRNEEGQQVSGDTIAVGSAGYEAQHSAKTMFNLVRKGLTEEREHCEADALAAEKEIKYCTNLVAEVEEYFKRNLAEQERIVERANFETKRVKTNEELQELNDKVQEGIRYRVQLQEGKALLEKKYKMTAALERRTDWLKNLTERILQNISLLEEELFKAEYSSSLKAAEQHLRQNNARKTKKLAADSKKAADAAKKDGNNLVHSNVLQQGSRPVKPEKATNNKTGLDLKNEVIKRAGDAELCTGDLSKTGQQEKVLELSNAATADTYPRLATRVEKELKLRGANLMKEKLVNKLHSKDDTGLNTQHFFSNAGLLLEPEDVVTEDALMKVDVTIKKLKEQLKRVTILDEEEEYFRPLEQSKTFTNLNATLVSKDTMKNDENIPNELPAWNQEQTVAEKIFQEIMIMEEAEKVSKLILKDMSLAEDNEKESGVAQSDLQHDKLHQLDNSMIPKIYLNGMPINHFNEDLKSEGISDLNNRPVINELDVKLENLVFSNTPLNENENASVCKTNVNSFGIMTTDSNTVKKFSNKQHMEVTAITENVVILEKELQVTETDTEYMVLKRKSNKVLNNMLLSMHRSLPDRADALIVDDALDLNMVQVPSKTNRSAQNEAAQIVGMILSELLLMEATKPDKTNVRSEIREVEKTDADNLKLTPILKDSLSASSTNSSRMEEIEIAVTSYEQFTQPDLETEKSQLKYENICDVPLAKEARYPAHRFHVTVLNDEDIKQQPAVSDGNGLNFCKNTIINLKEEQLASKVPQDTMELREEVEEPCEKYKNKMHIASEDRRELEADIEAQFEVMFAQLVRPPAMETSTQLDTRAETHVCGTEDLLEFKQLLEKDGIALENVLAIESTGEADTRKPEQLLKLEQPAEGDRTRWEILKAKDKVEVEGDKSGRKMDQVCRSSEGPRITMEHVLDAKQIEEINEHPMERLDDAEQHAEKSDVIIEQRTKEVTGRDDPGNSVDEVKQSFDREQGIVLQHLHQQPTEIIDKSSMKEMKLAEKGAGKANELTIRGECEEIINRKITKGLDELKESKDVHEFVTELLNEAQQSLKVSNSTTKQLFVANVPIEEALIEAEPINNEEECAGTVEISTTPFPDNVEQPMDVPEIAKGQLDKAQQLQEVDSCTANQELNSNKSIEEVQGVTENTGNDECTTNHECTINDECADIISRLIMELSDGIEELVEGEPTEGAKIITESLQDTEQKQETKHHAAIYSFKTEESGDRSMTSVVTSHKDKCMEITDGLKTEEADEVLPYTLINKKLQGTQTAMQENTTESEVVQEEKPAEKNCYTEDHLTQSEQEDARVDDAVSQQDGVTEETENVQSERENYDGVESRLHSDTSKLEDNFLYDLEKYLPQESGLDEKQTLINSEQESPPVAKKRLRYFVVPIAMAVLAAALLSVHYVFTSD